MTEDDTHVELVHQYLVTVIYIEIYDPEISPTAALPKLSVHINLHQPSLSPIPQYQTHLTTRW